MLAIVTRLRPEFGRPCGPLIPSASEHETTREALNVVSLAKHDTVNFY
jgi:hypothetical protein